MIARRLLLTLTVVGCARPASVGMSRAVGRFAPTVENRALPPGSAPDGMVWIPGGEFSMGADDPRGDPSGGIDALADARPIHRVRVDGFWLDRTEVTNAAFTRFVAAIGWVTVAERTPTAEEFPGAPRANLVAGGIVFAPAAHALLFGSHYQWWRYVPGASWRHPRGPDSDIVGHDRDPVVQVAYADAEAYARWAGKRLPTEAELELAARGGLSGQKYAWGDELSPGGRFMANTFQGHFPDSDIAADGYAPVAPVASFPPNRYGVFDIAGNVWEWCSDWYRADYYGAMAARGAVADNPRGPDDSFDPIEPRVPKRVQRGGSFLCSAQYCARYLVGSRGKGEPSSGGNHLGFRCAR